MEMRAKGALEKILKSGSCGRSQCWPPTRDGSLSTIQAKAVMKIFVDDEHDDDDNVVMDGDMW